MPATDRMRLFEASSNVRGLQQVLSTLRERIAKGELVAESAVYHQLGIIEAGLAAVVETIDDHAQEEIR